MISQSFTYMNEHIPTWLGAQGGFPFFIDFSAAIWNVFIQIRINPHIVIWVIVDFFSCDRHSICPLWLCVTPNNSPDFPFWQQKIPVGWLLFSHQDHSSTHTPLIIFQYQLNLGGNVGICVCWLHLSNDRHFYLLLTCRQCQANTSAAFCYVSHFFGCGHRVGETCCRHTLLHVHRNQY